MKATIEMNFGLSFLPNLKSDEEQFAQILGKESDKLKRIHDFLHDFQRLGVVTSHV